MVRVLSLGFVLLLALGLYFAPAPAAPRLAARGADALLALVPEDAPGEGKRTLAQLVLDGVHAYDRTEASRKLGLAGVRFVAETGDPLVHLLFRRAVIRALRTEASAQGYSLLVPGEELPVEVGASFLGLYDDGRLVVEYQPTEGPRLRVEQRFHPPDKRALLPPLIAILLAVLIRRPVPSLLLGIVAGTYLLRRQLGASVAASLGNGTLDVGRTYFWSELVDPERYWIIAFVVFMLAMVGMITKNGGIRGLMDQVAGIAGSVRSTQVATYLMGLGVFFDDYANTILVGSTMRPLSDRFRIAREKLAYIVDSTAAPVAGISIFSTWIAYEVSTFSAQLPAAGLLATDGYAVFIETLPYRFYCIFTLVMVALVTFSGRDFGPMLRAERRARQTGLLVREGGKPLIGKEGTDLRHARGVTPRARRALVPILTFVLGTLAVIFVRGGGPSLGLGRLLSIEGATTVLYQGSGSFALAMGSLAGLLVAFAMSVAIGLAGPVVGAALRTLRSMGIAIAILYCAWMIGAVCSDLGTAPLLTELVSDALDPRLLPLVLFLLAGVVAFSTGSSWSTMSILLPLVVSLAYSLGEESGLAHLGGHFLMVLSIGAVLEGAIFGDHCSPISDTTVMSSIAAASDHIDHVRTQAPYAVASMLVAMVAGYFPAAFLGLSPWIGMLLGAGLLVVLLLLRGKHVAAA